MAVKAYEVTLKGYYSGNDMTDDLILWVGAASEEAIYLAAGGCSFKIQDIRQSDVEVDDCEWLLPRDASEVSIAVAERAIIYRDKEVIAIDEGRLVIWNEQRQASAILSYGPESLNSNRLSERERQLLINYEISLDGSQSPQFCPWD